MKKKTSRAVRVKRNFSIRVFGVAELAEKIFLELPIDELLLTAPLVCKQWHNSIAGSSKLQQALFFQPIVTSGNNRVVKNPYLHLPDEPTEYDDYRPWWYAGRYRSAEPGSLMGVDCMGEAYEYPEASWRRMLVCQPANEQLRIRYVDWDLQGDYFPDSDGNESPEPLGLDDDLPHSHVFTCRVPGGVKLGYATKDREPAFAVHGVSSGVNCELPYAELVPEDAMNWVNVFKAKGVFEWLAIKL